MENFLKILKEHELQEEADRMAMGGVKDEGKKKRKQAKRGKKEEKKDQQGEKKSKNVKLQDSGRKKKENKENSGKK